MSLMYCHSCKCTYGPTLFNCPNCGSNVVERISIKTALIPEIKSVTTSYSKPKRDTTISKQKVAHLIAVQYGLPEDELLALIEKPPRDLR